jgi:hypothetical protein
MNTHKILMGKPLGKCVHERLRGSFEGHIKLEYRDIVCEDGGWVRLTQDCVQWQVVVLTGVKVSFLLS